MKKLTLLLIAAVMGLISFASELVLVPTGSMERVKEAFSLPGLTVHLYNDHYVIGTAETALPVDYKVLAENAWQEDEFYYVLRFNPAERESYINTVAQYARVLHQEDDFLVVSVERSNTVNLYPAIHGGMVRISPNPARLPGNNFQYKTGTLDSRNDIWALLAQVDTANLQDYVQHLQDYGTRNAYKAGGIQAQNWIFDTFTSFGLDVELHDFSMPSGPASDNVIATLTGTQYPDEYVVLGAHYDSYTGSNNEPGADDNASGTAGILEIARILSQYEFDRSIIFAAWSGEEYGLYGSEAWATEAAQNDMNILGYFNIDMAGYLEPGSYIHTDVIAPASAAELKQFYRDVCAIYLPDFEVENGALSGGDSDHTSFNNNGYQGIFPFEDSQDYSPYIHTANDVVGLSVNNFEQHGIFVKATLASVVSMADMLPSPENLTGVAGDSQVGLSWTGIDDVDYYNIYRNGDTTAYATTTDLTFSDNNVTNGEIYTYYVTATFLNTGEESGPSNVVTVVPMPPIAFPFYDDFETGAPYWSFESPWGLQSGIYHSTSYSMTESPSGNYAANMDVSTSLRSINLSGATSADISFWTRYQLEENYDFMYLEVSTDGVNWDEIDNFTGNQNTWTQLTYPLTDYLNKENVTIRFHFTSDVYIEAQGMFIDDVEIDVVGVGIGEGQSRENVVRIHPNPATDHAMIHLAMAESGKVRVYLSDVTGKMIREIADTQAAAGELSIPADLTGLQNGVYFVVLEANGTKSARNLIIRK